MYYAFSTYMEETVSLVRSLVIKFEDQNTLINDRLNARGILVSSDPKTWKYNLNLSGEYHSIDEPMTVISSDTKNEIPFTKTSLLSHPRTLVDYRRGGSLHASLVARYPFQRILIDGITKPIDINTVVTAKNFEILSYDGNFIGKNETGLIPALQKWTNQWFHRWYNPDFNGSASYYSATMIAQYVFQVVNAIKNIRLNFAHTEQAASFHIWSYLSDHYNLDEYRGNLSTTQALWLYRNLRAIRNRTGRQDKLTSLLKEILAPKKLVAESMRVFHTNEFLIGTGNKTARFAYGDVDTKEINFNSASVLTAVEALEETEDKGLLNSQELDLDAINLDTEAKESEVANHPTGLLQISEKTDFLSKSLDLKAMKINYWPYLAELGIYNNDITLEAPKVGAVTLSRLEWFIVFMYAGSHLTDSPLKVIPEVTLWDVVPLAPVVKTDLATLIDRRKIPDDTFIDMMFDHQIDPLTVVDEPTFETFIDEVFETRFQHELIWESPNHPLIQGMYENLSRAFFINHTCTLGGLAGTDMEEWMDNSPINVPVMNTLDWRELCRVILKDILGIESNAGMLTSDQTAMVDILDKLTSYAVMLTIKGTSKNAKRVELPNLLFYDWTWSSERKIEIPLGLRLMPYYCTDSYTSFYKWTKNHKYLTFTDFTYNRIHIDPSKSIYPKLPNDVHYRFSFYQNFVEVKHVP